ncbi:MAG: DUF1015 domain-containing protein [Peptostreptococcaceae bacterium]
MAIVRPFKAIRPAKEFVSKVAELPYDVMNRDEAKNMVIDNEYSFLHIDRAEVDLSKNINEYDEQVYIKAKENLDKFLEKNILIKDNEESIYIYEEVMNARSQIGIVACVSVEESLNGTIKKHEYTKPDKELDRTNHIKYCKANTGTILITYRNKESINKIIYDYINKYKPIYDFTTNDKIQHTVWKISDKSTINELVEAFKIVPNLYIADGHHRATSAENVAKEMKIQNPNHTGNEEYNFYLAMIAPDKDLLVLDYNRVIKDLNNNTKEEFISQIKENFNVKMIINDEYKPTKKGYFGMYLDGKWYELIANQKLYTNEDTVLNLDISILHNYIISPILGVTNPREDKRIDFIGGIRGIKELEKRVNEDMKVAFSLYPTSMNELMEVADKNKVMPAKSTWFEPKVRCGLFLHEIE